MQKETEIKLRVSRETLAALREHPLLKKRNKSGWERLELSNQYFDTPEGELAQAKVALRIRRDGDQIIQTMKTRGQSVAGLSERNEYNWDLSKAKLDLKKARRRLLARATGRSGQENHQAAVHHRFRA